MNFYMALGNSLYVAWLIFFAYWLVASFHVNRMERRDSPGQRLGRIFLALVAIYLLNSTDPRLGVLNEEFVRWRPWVLESAVALTWAGLAVAIWARYHIGRYWSAAVALREEHKLIRSGPYARIRHPIYTGILMMMAGTALAIGRYSALLAFAITLAGIVWKARREEALLASQFGEAFEEHRRHTGFFLPRLS